MSADENDGAFEANEARLERLAVDVGDEPVPEGWTEIEPVYETPEEIEELLQELDAAEARSENYQAQESTVDRSSQDQAPEDKPEAEDFEAVVDQIPDDQRKDYGHQVAIAFSDRVSFEAQKNPDNDTIGGKLAAVQNNLVLPSAAAILIAAQVDPNFINRSISSGSRYNVYAAQKVADLVGALDGRGVRNANNNAITRSLFRCRAANIPFTGEVAKAAACDKVRVSNELKGVLIRHTVSTGTMATQASSTMNALETLDIVQNKGNAKFPVYEPTDTPQTRRLELALAA